MCESDGDCIDLKKEKKIKWKKRKDSEEKDGVVVNDGKRMRGCSGQDAKVLSKPFLYYYMHPHLF